MRRAHRVLYALRAATGLAQLRHSRRRSEQPHAVLRTIYEKFTEGFDYPDLIRARAVLDSGQ
jgi:predicted ATPase